MSLLKNVFIIAAIGILHHLDSMDWQKSCYLVHVQQPSQPVRASDFQIYQFLSAATKDNRELYLPEEVTDIIAMNACTITYQEHGACLNSPDDVLYFIRDSLNTCTSHMTIIDILQTCLSYSRKSLTEIRYSDKTTVLHSMKIIDPDSRLDCIKIVLLVAGDQAWDLIKTQDITNSTVLHSFACVSSPTVIKELLSYAPCPQEIWELICARTYCGETALYKLASRCFTIDSIITLLSYAPSPEKAWSLINMVDIYGKTALVLAFSLGNGNREIIEVFESYRPQGY
jgi:hypothetical protein